MKIYFNNNYTVNRIIDNTAFVVGDNLSKKIDIYFDGINTNNVDLYQCNVVIERPDGKTTNELRATAKLEGYYLLPIGGWICDVAGTLTITVKLKNGEVVETFGPAYKDVLEGVQPSNETIEQAQYDALNEAINEISIKAFDRITVEYVDINGENITSQIDGHTVEIIGSYTPDVIPMQMRMTTFGVDEEVPTFKGNVQGENENVIYDDGKISDYKGGH